MEYYSAIKNNELMKFLGKWIELESIIPSDVTQSHTHTHTHTQTTYGMLSLIRGH